MTTTKPFTMLSTAASQAFAKKVFMHVMTAQNLKRTNNKTVPPDTKVSPYDIWATTYGSPDGEGGIHQAYGGYARDRPLPRSPDVAYPASTYEVTDLEWEVQQMLDAGIDGITLNLNGFSSTNAGNWAYGLKVMQAVKNVGNGFKVIVMPECGGTNAPPIASFLDDLQQLYAYGVNYTLGDGRIVLSGFTAEQTSRGWTDSYWQSVISGMATRGYPIAFWPTTQAFEANLARMAPYSYGAGIWGSRTATGNDPTAVGTTSPKGRITAAHSTTGVDGVGLKYMYPVAFQDSRPRTANYQEASNSLTMRNGFQTAIEGGADFIQLVTWNDFSENSEMTPTPGHRWNLLDIAAYYIAWFKTGSAPVITKDCIYLSHRKQPYGAAWTYTLQTIAQALTGADAAKDTVEALVFAKDSTSLATVEITNGITRNRNIVSGISSFVVPLATGQVSAKLLRSGQPVATLTSPFPVTSTPYVQDLTYVMSSSLNEGLTIDEPNQPPAPLGQPNRWVMGSSINRWIGS